jgi:hypothetical protein
MYRDDVEALEARHTALEQEVAEKTRELDEAAQLLEDARAKARLPILDNIRIASPCNVEWSSMTVVAGDEHGRSRHCGQCDKTVFDLSELTREEAQALIVERAGNLCARYYRRADGRIQLADCTQRQRRQRMAIAAVALAGAAVGSAVAVVKSTSCRGDMAPDVTDIKSEPERIEQPVPELEPVPKLDERMYLQGLVLIDELPPPKLDREAAVKAAKKAFE